MNVAEIAEIEYLRRSSTVADEEAFQSREKLLSAASYIQCDHKQPDGKTAIFDRAYNPTCKICGKRGWST